MKFEKDFFRKIKWKILIPPRVLFWRLKLKDESLNFFKNKFRLIFLKIFSRNLLHQFLIPPRYKNQGQISKLRLEKISIQNMIQILNGFHSKFTFANLTWYVMKHTFFFGAKSDRWINHDRIEHDIQRLSRCPLDPKYCNEKYSSFRAPCGSLFDF